MFEMGIILSYKLRSGHLMGDAELGTGHDEQRQETPSAQEDQKAPTRWQRFLRDSRKKQKRRQKSMAETKYAALLWVFTGRYREGI